MSKVVLLKSKKIKGTQINIVDE